MRMTLLGVRQARPLTPRIGALTALTAFLGLGVGMTLLLYALAGVGQARPLTPRVGEQTALTAFLGLGVGMTLLLFALAGWKVGIVSTLSATSPVLILPLLWLRTGQRPAAGAWAGAALVVVGMALIFLR
jgi:drug/metabolite transporter (DMT)-like permease